MRALCVLSVSLGALVVAGCASDDPTAPTHESAGTRATLRPWRGDAPVVRAIQDAAEHARVPTDVLLALGWAETRFVTPTADVHGHGDTTACGLFGLDAGDARAQAATLAGTTERALCDDVAIEARGAALRLRALAGDDAAPPMDDLDAWYGALDRWHPALEGRAYAYGAYVMRLARRGFRTSDALGHTIYAPPDLAITHRTAASIVDATDGDGDDVGVTRAAAAPDTDLVSWRGPACDYRASSRGPGDVTYVIIHTCEGGFAGCLSTLVSCGGSEVSAHYVVSYTGERVQAVEEHDTAWHVGCLNGPSIGIEHEGFAGADSHPEEQYCASAELVRSICDRWGIPCDRDHVIGHVEANERFCGGDHWDPGPNWDWGHFMDLVGRGGCHCAPTPEVCDGADNDCNGAVDEGVTNACGTCGDVPAESCNGADDDCDGAIDEGVCLHARIDPAGLPDALDLGMWSAFNLTIVNDGTTPWNEGALALAVNGEGAEGIAEIVEPRAVAAGESIAARVRVRANEEQQTVALLVAATVDGAPMEASWRWETTARKPLFGARFVDVSVPGEVRAGETASGWGAVVNEGRAAWPAGTIVTTRETTGGVTIESTALDEIAPGETARIDLRVAADDDAAGRAVERTLVLRDPDGEIAAWPAAERVVSVVVARRDGSLVTEDEPAEDSDMLAGGCATTGRTSDASMGLGAIAIAALIVVRRRRRR